MGLFAVKASDGGVGAFEATTAFLAGVGGGWVFISAVCASVDFVLAFLFWVSKFQALPALGVLGEADVWVYPALVVEEGHFTQA